MVAVPAFIRWVRHAAHGVALHFQRGSNLVLLQHGDCNSSVQLAGGAAAAAV